MASIFYIIGRKKGGGVLLPDDYPVQKILDGDDDAFTHIVE